MGSTSGNPGELGWPPETENKTRLSDLLTNSDLNCFNLVKVVDSAARLTNYSILVIQYSVALSPAMDTITPTEIRTLEFDCLKSCCL